MSLRKQIAELEAKKRAEAARKADPELEAKLDRFMAENPQVVERLQNMGKQELVRMLMAEKIESSETVARRNRAIEPWVRAHPEIVSKIQDHLKIKAPLSPGHAIQASNTVQKPGMRISP